MRDKFRWKFIIYGRVFAVLGGMASIFATDDSGSDFIWAWGVFVYTGGSGAVLDRRTGQDIQQRVRKGCMDLESPRICATIATLDLLARRLMKI
jgi:hypothetical protein